MAEPRDRDSAGIDSVGERQNSLTFDEKVIKKIVGISAGETPGILAMSGSLISGITDMLKSGDDPTKGISVEVGRKQVAVDMKVVCEYGRNIPALFQGLVGTITAAMKEMTGLDVVEVNVHVADILTKDDFDRRKKADAKLELEAPSDDFSSRRVE